MGAQDTRTRVKAATRPRATALGTATDCQSPIAGGSTVSSPAGHGGQVRVLCFSIACRKPIQVVRLCAEPPVFLFSSHGMYWSWLVSGSHSACCARALSARESDVTAQAAATRARVDAAAAQWSARISQAMARAVAVGQRHPSSSSSSTTLLATRPPPRWTNGTGPGDGGGSVTDSGSGAPFFSGLPGAVKAYYVAEHDFCSAFDQYVARQFAPGLTRLLVQAEGEGTTPGSAFRPSTIADASTDGTCQI
jgi:hypothetical protein